jgi:hypothetical protein
MAEALSLASAFTRASRRGIITSSGSIVGAAVGAAAGAGEAADGAGRVAAVDAPPATSAKARTASAGTTERK